MTDRWTQTETNEAFVFPLRLNLDILVSEPTCGDLKDTKTINQFYVHNSDYSDKLDTYFTAKSTYFNYII